MPCRDSSLLQATVIAATPALAAEFTGCVSLEWEKLWHPYLAPLDDALTAAKKRNWW